MTALASSALSTSLAGPSQPGPSQPSSSLSHPSSPASPSANFGSAQQAALNAAVAGSARGHTHLRSGSRPGTPTSAMLNGTTVNGSSNNNSISSSSNNNNNIGGPSLEPPPGVSYADFIASWNDAHVARWLTALDPHGKCAAHAGAFRVADIRGSILLDLDQPSLKEIGVTSIGDRIRILNAVKSLRIRCSTKHAQVNGHGGHGSSVSSLASSSSGTTTTANALTHSSPKLTVTNTDSVEALTRQQQQQQQQHHRSRRPAPLQLRSPSQTQNDLPRLIRDTGPMPDSARSTGATPMRSLPLPNSSSQSQANTPQAASSSHSSSGSGSGSNLGSGRPHLPPLPPPPRTQMPLPPSQGSRGQPGRLLAGSGRRTPTQAEAPPPPHYAPPPVPSQAPQQNQQGPTMAQTPTQSQNPVLLTPSSSASAAGGWKGEYGLPAGPRPGQGVNASSRATSPLPGGLGRRSPGGVNTHTKAPSYSASSTNTASIKTAPRPNTSGGHPYATAGGSTSGGSSSSSSSLQPPPQSGGGAAAGASLSLALSPIAESFLGTGGLPTPVPPTAGSSASSSSVNLGTSTSTNPTASAYHVGRGPFRPSTPSSHTGQGGGAPSLDDLRRRLVRFRLAEDGHSAIINVTECANGVEVLERVLRKFGKLGSGINGSGSGNVDPDSDEGGLSIDGWAVYLDWGDDEAGPAKPLREAELLTLCSAGPDHPVREHGLTVRRTNKPKRSKTLQQIFGDPGTPHSPIPQVSVAQDDEQQQHLGNSSVAFPRTLTPSQERDREREMRNMKRASSISVLSGLGVRDPERILDSSESAASHTPASAMNANANGGEKSGGKSPSASSFAGKIRTFLGARPPSELIATHLPAYFPYTQPKVLRRTVRQSMRFSSGAGLGQRDSAIAGGAAGLAANARRASRMSTATTAGGGRTSMALEKEHQNQRRASMASLPPPPVPDKNRMSTDEVPRMSVSAEDGHSIDLHGGEKKDDKPTPHLLPPVNFPSESFADSFHDVTVGSSTGPSSSATALASGSGTGAGAGSDGGARSGPTPTMSRTPSTASRVSHRFSYMSELRARRDRSDTASMLTVDEITAEVELNRRKSLAASVRSHESSSVASASARASMSERPASATAAAPAVSTGAGAVAAAEGGEKEPSSSSPEVDEEEILMDEDEDEEGDEMGSDVDDEDTLDEEEEDEEDEEATLANEDEDAPVKSTRGKRGAKWIRGALIGAGSFGSVYLGMDAMNGLLMAVKQVELPTGSGPNEQRKKSMLEALEREIDLLRELQHENIVQYLDSSSDDKHLYIFLEYVPGGSVTALLRNYGAFEEALCRHFVRQILQGLNYLHSRDIIHRDIKGANILVDNKGGIKISDFGISKKVEETFLGGHARGHRPSLQGSVYWMAPEVVKQLAHTRKADIWSVGCLVVEMLTGNHPYPTLNQMQAIFKIGSSAKPTVPSDISPECEDFLQKTFEVKHEARPDADELLQHPWIVHGPYSSSASSSSSTTKTKAAKS
ncbi:hypothetical protein ACEPAG_5609 [Sanghuangporus baumii]